MRRFKELWNDFRLYEKMFSVLLLVLFCVIMIAIWLYPMYYDMYLVLSWLVELYFICFAVVNWRKRRISAYLDITAAVIMGIFAIQGTLQLLY